MKRLFVDTSAFAAIEDTNDQNHRDAINFWNRVAGEPVSIYTTNFVFDETYTLLLTRVGRDAAIDFGTALRESRVIQMIYVDELIQGRAWDIAVKYKDKMFSFTDCTSFAAMVELGIVEAFSFDLHFEQYGSLSRLPSSSARPTWSL